MAKNKLVVIESAVLFNMASNPNFTKEFGFLAPLAKMKQKIPGGCGKCGRGNAKMALQTNGIKLALVGMGAERKKRLKELLNAEKVRIRVSENGRVRDHTF